MLCPANAERQGWHPGAAAVGRRRDETPRPMIDTLTTRATTMVIVRTARAPEKGKAPPRTHITPADDACSGPRHAAVRWINACEALDHKEAVRLRRELLKRFGILISLA